MKKITSPILSGKGESKVITICKLNASYKQAKSSKVHLISKKSSNFFFSKGWKDVKMKLTEVTAVIVTPTLSYLIFNELFFL